MSRLLARCAPAVVVVLVLAGCGAGEEATPAATVVTEPSPTTAPAPASVPSTSTTARPASSVVPAPSSTTTRPAPVALGPEWTQRDGLVLIEATASGDARTLLRDLEALGLREGVVFGRVVNGWLPVASFASAQRLDSLAFVRPTGAGTG